MTPTDSVLSARYYVDTSYYYYGARRYRTHLVLVFCSRCPAFRHGLKSEIAIIQYNAANGGATCVLNAPRLRPTSASGRRHVPGLGGPPTRGPNPALLSQTKSFNVVQWGSRGSWRLPPLSARDCRGGHAHRQPGGEGCAPPDLVQPHYRGRFHPDAQAGIRG